MSSVSSELSELTSLEPSEHLTKLAELSRRVADGDDASDKQLVVDHILTVFEDGLGAGKGRLAVGEALAALGDPRLRAPGDEGYFVEVDSEVGPVVIGRFLVTNLEFQSWVDAGGYEDRSVWDDEGWAWLQAAESPWPVSAKGDSAGPFVVPNQPVVGVTHHEASAYARAMQARLPRPDERMYVCRGAEQRPYPWGSPFGEGNANTREEVLGRPCAVGMYVGDRTPEGVYDLAGNVAEWTSQTVMKFVEDESASREAGAYASSSVDDTKLVGEMQPFIVVHPGAWDQPSMAAWAKAKELQAPAARWANLGFRLARDPEG